MRKIYLLVILVLSLNSTSVFAQSITCPGNITVFNISSPSLEVVFYDQPTAFDELFLGIQVPITPTRVSGPASGSAFPIGTTTVTWQATIACGNPPFCTEEGIITCSFTVTILPLIIYYRDSDGDGRGNPNLFVGGTDEVPPGYVTDNTDCNDNAINVWQSTILYVDNDGDTYDNGTFPVCWGNTWPYGYVLDLFGFPTSTKIIPLGYKLNTNGSDCDDTNGSIWKVGPFYVDQDEDGYDIGISNVCYGDGPPSGYSETTNGSDCDDNNTAINPATVWYKDADNDFHSDGTTLTQCTRPTDYRLASELAATSGDCDDNAPLVWALVTFYIDQDHDGYDAGTTTLCSGLINPLSLFLAGLSQTTNGSDCDDDNAAVNPTTVWYKDADNDLHSDGTTLTQCEQPTGYSLASELAGTSDCNDNANLIWALVTFYTDNDHDGYDAGSTVACVGLIPPGSTLTTNGSDCDDNNAAVHSNFSFYADNDDDGYGAGSLIAGICAVDANTPPEGYSANNNDCDDTNDAINPATVWYQDADNDGYGTGFSGTQCLRPPGYKLQSELIANSGDCDDTKAAINPVTVWYQDADNDGYSSGATQTQCLRLTGYKLQSELVAIIGDCNDNDPGRNPVVQEVCKNNIDDNCDGIIDDKAICEQCTNGSNLNTTNITSTSARFNWSATANPEQWRIQYKSTKPNAKWVDLPLFTGNIRSVDVSTLAPNQDYSWQIGARCDGKWTIYSNSVKFKTLANSVGSKIPITKLNNSTLKLYPNPSRGQFMLDLQVEDKINVTATIQLIDMTGKIVQSQIAAVNGGTLQKSIRISSALSKGIYMVRIIVNDKVYKTQLVYENRDVIIH